MIAAKFDYLNIKFKQDQVQGSFFVLLIIDVIFLIVYLLIKFKYWTLSQETIDNQLNNKQRQKQQNQCSELFVSFKQCLSNFIDQLGRKKMTKPSRIRPDKIFNSQLQINQQNYVIFNDYVYPTDKFKELHPGGQFIMSLMNKREIDRFMYGNYAAQLTPGIKPHNHTQDSMRLCGPPVGKILRCSPLEGLKQFSKCEINQLKKIHQTSETYLIYLRTEGVQLQFKGFEQSNQIGQYFSLTILNQNGKNRTTRLYTTIWSMRHQNLEYMKQFFYFQTEFKQFYVKVSKSEIQMQETISNPNQLIIKVKTQCSSQNICESTLQRKKQLIPLIIKKYDNGELTPRLLAENFNGEIVLSQPMGAGMKFDQIPSKGKVIIVCGGTGILPFCDFIDLLFKRVKFLESPSLSNSLAKNDPLVAKDFIKEREFVLYCAAENALELPALTFYQINSLCQSQKIKFRSTMKVKKHEELIKKKFASIKLDNRYFNEKIKRHLKEGNLAQIYICGPPQMNHSIGKIMSQNQVDPKIYHYV